MNRLLCLLGFHRWADWSVKSRGAVQRKSEMWPVGPWIPELTNVGRWLYQERYCVRCGYTQNKMGEVTL